MYTLPATMKAAVYVKPGVVSVQQRALPELQPDDVLLRVSYCGICGTDLHMVLDGWGQPNSILGHEYSGTIVALGGAVDGWHVGQTVVAQPAISCGKCTFCLAHRPSLCEHSVEIGMKSYQGAFAEYKSVPAKDLLAVPDGLTAREAALCEPLAVALHCISRSPVTPDMRVMVSGAGPIGLLIVAVLAARGQREIVVCEPIERRRRRALQVGAASAVAPDELAVPALPIQQVEQPFDVVYECSGKAAAMECALGNLAKGGTLVLMGTGLKPPTVDAMRVITSEITITGALNYDENGFHEAMQLLSEKTLPLEHLIEPFNVPLERLLENMHALVAGELAGKVMVDTAAVAGE
jgi:(R,R)-butanediol dehydrogenase / meso-butanediol dehydrogenase / diacetyl reductase